MYKATVYHGTRWEFEEGGEYFLAPSKGYSDYETCYFTESEKVAGWFCDYHSTLGASISVVLKGELSLKNPYMRHSEILSRRPWVDIDDQEFHVANDREELYPALMEIGHDAMIIEDNYENQAGGSDIAVFGNLEFGCQSVNMCIDGEWTGFISPDDAIRRFEQLQERALKKSRESDPGFSP